MRRFPLLLGLVLGLGAILLAWRGRASRQPPPPEATSPTSGGDLGVLRARALVVPVAGLSADELRDSFADPRDGHTHLAIDILAARGTRVVAADDGTVARLLASARGGLTVYQLDPTATYCYYYAHLDGYALGLREGQPVRRGQTLGFVGSTGNASARTPHLHFAVSRLGPERQCGEGTALNPFLIWRSQ